METGSVLHCVSVEDRATGGSFKKPAFLFVALRFMILSVDGLIWSLFVFAFVLSIYRFAQKFIEHAGTGRHKRVSMKLQ